MPGSQSEAMQVEIFSPLADFLLERFVKFEQPFNGKNWEEFYQAVNLLKSRYPDRLFRDEPYIYVDLARNTSGYLFIDSQQGELFYVYQ